MTVCPPKPTHYGKFSHPTGASRFDVTSLPQKTEAGHLGQVCCYRLTLNKSKPLFLKSIIRVIVSDLSKRSLWFYAYLDAKEYSQGSDEPRHNFMNREYFGIIFTFSKILQMDCK